MNEIKTNERNRKTRRVTLRGAMVWVLSVILVLLLALLVRYGYIRMSYPGMDALHGIPAHSIMVIEGEQFTSFAGELSSGMIWTEGLADAGSLDQMSFLYNEFLVNIDEKGELLGLLLEKNRFCMALVPRREGGPALLFVHELGSGHSARSLEVGLAPLLKDFRLKRLLQIEYYAKELEDGSTLYVTHHKGLLLASTNREVFEMAFYTVESGNSILNSDGFVQVREQLSKSQNPYPRCYISHEGLFGWFTRFLMPESRSLLAAIPEMGDWSAFELQQAGNSIHMQGFTHSGAPADDGLFSLLSDGSDLTDPGSVLPTNTLFYEQTGISGMSEYHRRLTGYHSSRSHREQHPVSGEVVDSALWLFDEMAIRSLSFALTAPADTLAQAPSLLLMNSARIVHAERALMLMVDTTRKLSHQNFSLYPLRERHLLPALLGVRLSAFSEAWVTIYDDWLILSPTSQGLLSVINSIILQRTLSETKGYHGLNERLQGPLSRRYYFNTSHAPFHLHSMALHDQKLNTLQFLRMMPEQIMVGHLKEQDVLLTDLVALPSGSTGDEVLYREVVLDGVPVHAPVLFVDHRSNEAKAITVDHTGNVYLINRRGSIDWKTMAEERPQSDLFVVDMYQNGRQQLLFLGEKKLHLFQADGRYVRGYPVELPVGFASNLSVLDYDRNGNYRLLYEDENGRIANIDLSGRHVGGWLHPAISGLATPVSWVRAGGADCLIAIDTANVLHVLDRRGRERFSGTERMHVSNRSHVVVTKSLGDEFITYLDREGRLCQVSTEGELYKHELLRFSSESLLARPFSNTSFQNGLLVFEPNRHSLYDQELKLSARHDPSTLQVASVSYYRRGSDILCAGLDKEGAPFVLFKGNPEPVQIAGKGFEHLLLLGKGNDGQHIAMIVKGSIIRIIRF